MLQYPLLQLIFFGGIFLYKIPVIIKTIGINKQNGVTIEDNTVAIDGGDYTNLTPGDSLGNANAAILVGEGNTNVKSSGNDVTETSALRLDTTIVVSDLTVTAAPSGNGTLQFTLKL